MNTYKMVVLLPSANGCRAEEELRKATLILNEFFRHPISLQVRVRCRTASFIRQVAKRLRVLTGQKEKGE